MRKPTVCILAAVERELAPLRRRENSSLWNLHWRVSGVGKASGAAEATTALCQLQPDLIVNIGCAGAFQPPSAETIPFPSIGDVVVGDCDIFADEGVDTADGFKNLRELKLPTLTDDDGTLHNEVPLFVPPAALINQVANQVASRFTLVTGPLLTVSTCSGTNALAAELASRWSGLAESMEGAAIALAGRRFGCPVVEIRAISNYVGERSRETWDIDGACEHAAQVVHFLLNSHLLLDALGHE